jgi:hypothetical protein
MSDPKPLASTVADDGSTLELLRRARTDSAYAKLLCSALAGMVRDALPLPPAWRDLLADALEEIAEDADPGRALGVKQPHRPTPLYRNIEIAIDYWRLRDRGTVKAKFEVAQTWGLHPDRVKEIAKNYRREARGQIAFREAIDNGPDPELRGALIQRREARRAALIRASRAGADTRKKPRANKRG